MTHVDEIAEGSTERMLNRPAPVIACPECDLLQREIALSRRDGKMPALRALLYRHIRHSLDRTIAFLLAAAILYVVANVFPIVGLEAQEA
jgi:paraquat-inducible protein A